MSLSQCSIYPKHSNLAALLVAINFDIVVITETFLDDCIPTIWRP